MQAIAQMKPTISRAIAVVTTELDPKNETGG